MPDPVQFSFDQCASSHVLFVKAIELLTLIQLTVAILISNIAIRVVCRSLGAEI